MTTSALRIRLEKRGGGALLRCTRPDGTATWQKHEGKQAGFFPFHDLTHFAVETELGFRQGFYGLLANGCTIEETEGKSPRGKPPAEAILVEHVVGLIERERVGGAAPLSAVEFGARLREMCAGSGIEAPREITDAELESVRKRVDELHSAWAALAEGAALELTLS